MNLYVLELETVEYSLIVAVFEERIEAEKSGKLLLQLQTEEKDWVAWHVHKVPFYDTYLDLHVDWIQKLTE